MTSRLRRFMWLSIGIDWFSDHRFHWWEMPGQVGNSSARAMGYILCIEKTGSELSQSIAIDELFLCGYRLIIDWPIPIDTNRYQLTHFIDWYYWLIGFPIIDFHRLETTRRCTSSLRVFFADIINPDVIIFCWHY